MVTLGSSLSASDSKRIVERAGLSVKGAVRVTSCFCSGAGGGVGGFFASVVVTFGGVRGFDSFDRPGGSSGALSLSIAIPSGALMDGAEIVMDFFDGVGGTVRFLSLIDGGGGGAGRSTEATDAEHVAEMPPSAPEQVHVQGPFPLTRLGRPLSHNPLVGTPENDWLLASPHAPSMGFIVPQEIFFLPFVQVQRHGLVPFTALAFRRYKGPSPAGSRPVVRRLHRRRGLASKASLAGGRVLALALSSARGARSGLPAVPRVRKKDRYREIASGRTT